MNYEDIIYYIYYNYNALQEKNADLFIANNFKFRPDIALEANSITNTFQNYNDLLNTFAFLCFNDIDYGLE